MKTKSFDVYLKKRLSQHEIAEIEKQAQLEKDILVGLQCDIATAISEYKEQEKIGFNELARKLGASPTQLSKIQKGKANLTIASLAHLFALLKKPLHIVVS